MRMRMQQVAKKAVLWLLVVAAAGSAVGVARGAIAGTPTLVYVYDYVEDSAGEKVPMTVQCSSKDDKLAAQTVIYGARYEWSFGLIGAGHTLFWCDVAATFQGYGTMHLHFVAYSKEREDVRLVVWKVLYDGLYVVNNIAVSSDMVFVAPWTTT